MKIEYKIKIPINFPESSSIPTNRMLEELFTEFLQKEKTISRFKESITERYTHKKNSGGCHWTKESKDKFRAKKVKLL